MLLSLCEPSGVQHMLCCIFCFVGLHFVSCEPNVVILSGLFILDCHIRFARTSIDNYFMVFLVYIKI